MYVSQLIVGGLQSFGSANKMSVSELLITFFRYYRSNLCFLCWVFMLPLNCSAAVYLILPTMPCALEKEDHAASPTLLPCKANVEKLWYKIQLCLWRTRAAASLVTRLTAYACKCLLNFCGHTGVFIIRNGLISTLPLSLALQRCSSIGPSQTSLLSHVETLVSYQLHRR